MCTVGCHSELHSIAQLAGKTSKLQQIRATTIVFGLRKGPIRLKTTACQAMLLSDIPLADLATEQHKPNERYQKSDRQLDPHAGSLVALHCGARRLSNPKKKPPCEMDEGVLGHWTRAQTYILDYLAKSVTYPCGDRFY
jgi:hypothetical protein